MSRLQRGGLIDRGRPLAFTFDGRPYSGFEGDTLASALVANDVRLVGRSFKYHRPRGILTAGSEEPNALVTLRQGASSEPNCRATMVPLADGLRAESQNRWPSLRFDAMALNQLAAPLLVAGFYYKTFMWPPSFWEKVYEPLIRRAAGLGALSLEPDPDCYDRAHGFCDLLIIGGGPAGLAAALAAGQSGMRVILVDEDRLLGGRLLSERHEIDGMPGHEWARLVSGILESLPNVTLLKRTLLFGIYDGREYGAVEQLGGKSPRQRLWKIVAKRALLASGAIERPIVFGNNDRPGVMTASAVSTYLNRFAAAPGQRAVVFTTTDSGWATAEDLVASGVELAAVIDAREQLPDASARLARVGVEILRGSVVTDVHGRSVGAVDVRTGGDRTRRLECDLVAVAGGWNPAIGLGSNLGARPVWSDSLHTFLLGAASPGLSAIGAAAGRYTLAEALASGAGAGAEAARDAGRAVPAMPVPGTSDETAALEPLWHSGSSAGKAFIDFQHDVTDKDVQLAAREGFVSIEHLKRYTTLGMATDQGRVGQLNGHAVLAAATGKTIAEAGTILSRSPFSPVSFGVLAGGHRDEHFRPERRTASHDWAVGQGAVFVDSGLWKRAQYYARPGDKDWLETVTREVVGTRSGVGICDISTLGKIDLHGPDAAVLLDRLYVNTFSTLPVGKARYGLMLREDGFVLDDGTTTRFAEDRFFVTTTTANAGAVIRHLDYARQVIWPDLDVQAVSVTEQWSSYAIAGPRSRDLLQQFLPDMDLSNEALPFMGAREFGWRGAPARLFRISFSGELAFEFYVPARLGDQLVRALFDTGREFGAVPYGIEALGVMRIEKGHPASNELNGETTAADLGLASLMSRKKDFIGRVMAARPGLTDPSRPALVGLRPVDPAARLRGGAHLLSAGARPSAGNDQGHVSSAAFSPALGHWIALALLKSGRDRLEERLIVHDPLRGPDVEVDVCSPAFVDPEGLRLRA